MAEIFISYSSKDRQRARIVAEALIRRGYSVWWDVNLLPGDDFSTEISSVIHSSKAVVVLWSKNAVDSRFVRDEASLASRLGKLIPVLIEPIVPPLGFQSYHYADLSDWTGDPDAPAVRQLFDGIKAKVPQPSSPTVNSTLAVQYALDTFKEEATYWVSISGSTPQRVEEYEAYLARFGDKAVFADLAHSRIVSLRTEVAYQAQTRRRFNLDHFGDRANVWLSIIAAVVTIAGGVAWSSISPPATNTVGETDPAENANAQVVDPAVIGPDIDVQPNTQTARADPAISAPLPTKNVPRTSSSPAVAKTFEPVSCGPFRDGDYVAIMDCVSPGGGDWKVVVSKKTPDAPSSGYTITGRIDKQYCGKAGLDGTSGDEKFECTAPPNGEGRLELLVRPTQPAGFDALHVPIMVTVTRAY